jgi:hypothetical protein
VGKSVEVVMADLAGRSTTDGRGAGPMTSTESTFAQVLAEVGLPSESMKDICLRQPTRSLKGEPPRTAGVHSKKITFDLRGLTPGRRGMPPWRRRHVIPNRITRQEHDGVHVYDVDDFFHEVRRYG